MNVTIPQSSELRVIEGTASFKVPTTYGEVDVQVRAGFMTGQCFDIEIRSWYRIRNSKSSWTRYVNGGSACYLNSDTDDENQVYEDGEDAEAFELYYSLAEALQTSGDSL